MTDIRVRKEEKSVMTMNMYQNIHVSAGGCHSSYAGQSLAFHRRLPGYAPTPLVNAHYWQIVWE